MLSRRAAVAVSICVLGLPLLGGSTPVEATSTAEQAPDLREIEPVSGKVDPSLWTALATGSTEDLPGHQAAYAVDGAAEFFIRSAPGDGSAVETALAALGGEITGRANDLVAVVLPVTKLSVVEAMDTVQWIGPPDILVHSEVTSEGVDVSEADYLHDIGLFGAGSRVAVFDDGFAEWGDRTASNDLPPAGTQLTVHFDLCTNPGANAHGTAVAEIVYDMAPAAQLSLICVDSTADLQDAVDWFDARDGDIIVMSMSFFGSRRGDGAGPTGHAGNDLLDGAVQDAWDKGIFWINAAGNSAEDHWTGPNTDVDADLWIEFASGDELNGVNEQLGPGEEMFIYARWDDWPDSNEDYDIYLYRRDTLAILCSGTVDQVMKSPFESCTYTNNTGGALDVGVAIRLSNVTDPPPIHLWVQNRSNTESFEYSVAAESIEDPATHPRAFAVGASHWWDPGTITDYSSQGPNTAGLIKPDITGPSSVTSASYGGSFGGTSASAPHVAGMAALMLERDWYLTNVDLWNRLECHAWDVGAAAKDNVFGSGELNANFAINDDFANPLPAGPWHAVNWFATDEAGWDTGGVNIQSDVWFSYETPLPGTVTFDTVGSWDLDCGFDTAIAVYEGTGLSDLDLVAWNNDLGWGATDSRVEIAAEAGVQYWIRVGGGPDAFVDHGEFVLSVAEDIPPDTEPPFWPDGGALWATAVTDTTATVEWTAATDNVGVVAYAVYVDRELVGVTDTGLTYTVTGLQPNVTYYIEVLAGDAAGNWGVVAGPGADITTGGSGTFIDDDDSIFEANIEWLAAQGITRGCNPPVNDLFCPDDPVTRGQMAAFLKRALNLTAGSGDTFTDDNDSVFEADIEALAAAGITRGCNPPTNDQYCPDDPVTRGQMAAFLQRGLGG